MADTPWTTPAMRESASQPRTAVVETETHSASVTAQISSTPRVHFEIKTVHVEAHAVVKVPAVKLPPANPRIRAKVRAHLICICCSALLTVLASLLTPGLIFHITTGLAFVPNACMETLDRIRER